MSRFQLTLVAGGILFALGGSSEVEVGIEIDDELGERRSALVVARGATDASVGAESVPSAFPIGGGAGYARTVALPAGSTAVTTAAGLKSRLQTATSGSIVYVSSTAVIDLTAETAPLVIPAGVVLASGRGIGGSPGALIRHKAPSNVNVQPLFQVNGAGVRITGLRIEGPGEFMALSTGIRSSGANLEIDNCEVFKWSDAAIYILNTPNTTKSHVHHNYIHHNRLKGAGYGVEVDSANVLIEANRFNYNRHSITGTGRPGTSYEARYNIALGGNNDNIDTVDMYAFDMHGSGDRAEIAGDWIKIHHNSFYDPDSYFGAIHISGIPQQGAWIYRNFFVHSTQADAISQRLFGPPLEPRRTVNMLNITAVQNAFGGANWGARRITSDRYLFADVSGDSLDDAIELGADAKFRVRKGLGTTFLAPVVWGQNGADIGVARYKLGDFNGDGRADLLSLESNGGFYVWRSTGSAFTGPVLWGQNGADIGAVRYQVSDVTGDGRSDVLSFESAGGFYVWRSTGSAFTNPALWGQNGADLPTTRYKLGDVSSEGRIDLMSVEPNFGFYAWLSTGTAFTNPSRWGQNGADIGANRYRLSDFTGDGRADLLSFESNGSLYVWPSQGTTFGTRYLWADTDAP